MPIDPSGYDKYWDRWFGPEGRNETAPETQLPALLQRVRDSPAGQAVLSIDKAALDNMQHTRLLAMVRGRRGIGKVE